jgi:hypothetical protein
MAGMSSFPRQPHKVTTDKESLKNGLTFILKLLYLVHLQKESQICDLSDLLVVGG